MIKEITKENNFLQAEFGNLNYKLVEISLVLWKSLIIDPPKKLKVLQITQYLSYNKNDGTIVIVWAHWSLLIKLNSKKSTDFGFQFSKKIWRVNFSSYDTHGNDRRILLSTHRGVIIYHWSDHLFRNFVPVKLLFIQLWFIQKFWYEEK